ncbi:MAG: asparaginase [Treponema sp.]|nr:asparaginase [Treponema sp.]
MESGVANGIVVTHGTDTISYTASLLFWLFSSADVPVVLSASGDLPEESDEARNNLKFAIQTAREMKNGVYMAYKCKLYSPLNLKFISASGNEFANWNMDKKIFTSQNIVSSTFMSVSAPDGEVVAKLMNEAASKLSVIKTYPGMKNSRILSLINSDEEIKSFIMELYSSGTGDMKDSDYSLKDILISGKKRGLHFYCTSQQECKVDFSKYSTASEVWRDGAVPMDILTTESAVALYFAASIIGDDDREINQLIEECVDTL